MKPTLAFSFAAVSLVLLAVSPARADLTTYFDKATFLTATGATEAADFHDTATGNRGLGPITVGDMTFTSASGDLWVLDWTSRLDNEELAISGLEHLDVDINLGGNVHAFGFEFVEPEYDPKVNATFVDSTFTVTLKSGATTVDSFTFNAPNDQAAFVGVWSTPAQGFDTVLIRETVGANENEFFGEFYVGTQPVPAPGAFLLGALGLGLVGWIKRRMA